MRLLSRLRTRQSDRDKLVQDVVDEHAKAARARAEVNVLAKRNVNLGVQLTRAENERDDARAQIARQAAYISELVEERADLRRQLDEAQATIRVVLDGANAGHEEAERLRAVAESNKRAYAGAVEEIERLREKLNRRAATETVTFDGAVEIVARDLYRTERAVPRNDDDHWEEQDEFERDCWRETATNVVEALGRAGALAPTEPACDLVPPSDEPTQLGADPERLDAAMHSRDTYPQRQAANTRLAHQEARAVQRDVAARLSTQTLPCGCLPGYECRCEVKA